MALPEVSGFGCSDAAAWFLSLDLPNSFPEQRTAHIRSQRVGFSRSVLQVYLEFYTSVQ